MLLSVNALYIIMKLILKMHNKLSIIFYQHYMFLMKEVPTGLNHSVNLKISPEQSDRLEMIDNLEISAAFKSSHLIPYLSSLWESLVVRSKNSQEGLPKFVFTDVIL